MISSPGGFCESSDKLLMPLPLCFVKQTGGQTQLTQSATCETRDRLLTHQEKKNLTCEDKRVYNTK